MNEVLTKITNGIYALGVKAGAVRNEMIASWVMQVSFEPPLVAVAVHKTRFTHGLLLEAGEFTLSILGGEQAGIVNQLKGAKEVTENTIGGVEVETASNGAPVLKDCVGYVELKIVRSVENGDHTLFIGEVTRAKIVSGGAPLSAFELDHYYGG
ncbi:MAG TPA: flavin reductase family protein [bacterium]|nr:flavin reductase family protein [bacterium]